MSPPRPMFGRARCAWGLAAVIVAAIAAGCGGSSGPLTQPSARDKAAGTVCDYAARCGNIGTGAAYATRDDCLTTWKGNIQNLWPPAECTKIDQTEYDVCIASINNGSCMNGLDVLTILSKCGKATVCVAP